jgi:hypothetical protein
VNRKEVAIGLLAFADYLGFIYFQGFLNPYAGLGFVAFGMLLAAALRGPRDPS